MLTGGRAVGAAFPLPIIMIENKAVKVWEFEPRDAVNPSATRAEWDWVSDWARKEGLSGKVFAVRTFELKGDQIRSRFVVYDGVYEGREYGTRNL